MRWRRIAQFSSGSVVINVIIVWATALGTIVIASYFAALKLYDFDFLGKERADSVNPIADLIDPKTNPETAQQTLQDWKFYYIDQATSPLEIFQAALAVATALGAAAFLVISIHRNARERREEKRHIAQAFADNYGKAAAQIAAADAVEQLAGLYAMNNLARAQLPNTTRPTPAERRTTQQCLDMICTYLRLAATPDTATACRPPDPVGGYGKPQKPATTQTCSAISQTRNTQQIALDLIINFTIDLAGTYTKDSDTEQYTFNFEGADLSGLTFHGEAWRHCGHLVTFNLQGAILHRTNFKRAYLHKTSLQNADLTEANLEDVKTHKINLTGSSLGGATIQGAVLNDAIICHANLESADLRRTMMHRADLTEANLQYAQLQHTELRHATLQYANLQGANLQDTNLRDTTLWGANLRTANLRRASLNRSQLQWTHPKGPHLTIGELLGVRTLASGAVDWQNLNQRLHVAIEAGMPTQLADALADACHSQTPPSTQTPLTQFSATHIHWAKALPDTFRGAQLDGVDFTAVEWVDEQGNDLPQSRWPRCAHRTTNHPETGDVCGHATQKTTSTVNLRTPATPRPGTDRPERTNRSDFTVRPHDTGNPRSAKTPNPDT